MPLKLQRLLLITLLGACALTCTTPTIRSPVTEGRTTVCVFDKAATKTIFAREQNNKIDLAQSWTPSRGDALTALHVLKACRLTLHNSLDDYRLQFFGLRGFSSGRFIHVEALGRAIRPPDEGQECAYEGRITKHVWDGGCRVWRLDIDTEKGTCAEQRCNGEA